MCCGQLTLSWNCAGTALVREGHRPVTHGVYRRLRDPVCLGPILVLVVGLPLDVASGRGFQVSLPLVPLVVDRIRLVERPLSAHFGDQCAAYVRRTERLVT